MIQLSLSAESIPLNSKFDLIQIEPKDVFYMCPEIFDSTKSIGLKYDIW